MPAWFVRLCAAAALTLLVVGPATAQAVLETFEAPAANWQVTGETAGGGTIVRSTVHAANGVASALLATAGAGARAAIRPAVDIVDAAANHQWEERPGT
jgi:hypothetical protein